MSSDQTKKEIWRRQDYGRKRQNGDGYHNWRKDIRCAEAHKHTNRFDESTNDCKSGTESQGCGYCKLEIAQWDTKKWIEEWEGIYG